MDSASSQHGDLRVDNDALSTLKLQWSDALNFKQ